MSASSSPIPASDAAALAGLSQRPTARARRRPGRILRGLGILCLVAALAIGAHIAWLLWGTGIETAHAQKQLRAQILEQFKEQAQHPLPVTPKTHHPVVSIKEGQPVGILVIQKIHLDMVLVNGTSTADLKKGPGHYIGTAYPWEEKGTTAIAGHRTTYLHPFWSLDKLAKGDLIRIRTRFGTFDYHVTRIMTIQPSEAWVLDQTKKATLVLTTCAPKFSASYRLAVFASR